MIPIYNVKIEQTLKPELLKMLPMSVFLGENAFVSNEEYVDPRCYGWYDAMQIIPFERRAIKNAKKSKSIDKFFEIMEKETDKVNCGTLADLGVSGTAIALVSIGYMPDKNNKLKYQCVPITSYAGGANLTSNSEDEDLFYPHVAGFATPMFGLKLLELVKGKNVGLRNINFVEGRGFEVYTQTIEDMFMFGEFLYETESKRKD